MTGADIGVGEGARLAWRWDVALSFAGEQRDYVERVAEALKARSVRCFYDFDEQVELWGKHLTEELPAIYGEQAAAVVVFVSAEYAARDWTRHERRAALTRAVRERREYVLPARFDDTPLPGLLSDMVSVDLRIRTPEQFATLIVDKLAALAITMPLTSAGAPGSAQDGETARPVGGVRVRDADLRLLGVHAAISVPGVPDAVPPEYVPRDADAGESGMREHVTAAAQRGGFVLLVGGSSAGKTRCAAEAVRALLPDWWLVHPAGTDQVAALAQAPPPRTVVWLDELQRYLDGEPRLAGGVIRALLSAAHPVVVIGTLWPDRYTAYVTVPAPGGDDRHAREREVLDLADVIRIDAGFSLAEQDRARAAAARDPRLRTALAAAGYGLTQTLAAAPQLVARWQDAKTASPYGWAVLTAALDAARLGARAPLSIDFLRAAAPGYCTSQQQAEAPESWFEQALDYATERLQGAASALSPAGAGMGQVAGYTAADYLVQHASRERRSARIPASTWDAAVKHIRDGTDAARLADSAVNRLLYSHAIPLYRRAADDGNEEAAESLASLLVKRADLGELRILAQHGDEGAYERLAGLLAVRLADVLAEHGDLNGAVQILRALAEYYDGNAAYELANLLEKRGDLDSAVQILRACADAGNQSAADRLTGLLAARGDSPPPMRRRTPRHRRREGRRDLDELHALDRAGSVTASMVLAWLQAGTGDLDNLRAQARTGDYAAATVLIEVLTERGDLDGVAEILRIRADLGEEYSADRLAELLGKRRDLNGLRARADAGDLPAAEMLARLGDRDAVVQTLRARADAGDEKASYSLDRVLCDAGDLDGLRARADAGDEYAAQGVAWLLADAGNLDELRTLANIDDDHRSWLMAKHLARQGDLDELRALADGNYGAASVLAGLLADAGNLDELRTRADNGDEYSAVRLAGLLTEAGDADGLRTLVDTGCHGAGEQLAGVLQAQLMNQGREEEAKRLQQFGLNPDGTIA